MKKTVFILTMLMLSLVHSSARTIVRDSLEVGAAVNVSPAQMIRGNVSGVHVSGTDGSITGALNTIVRGISSVHSDSEPLWIVDGAYLTSSIGQNRDAFWQPSYSGKSYTSALNHFYNLNPYDIESIEVLKDVAATSIYGSRGANGVIIIKTKLSRNDGYSVRWSSNIGANITDYGYTSLSHNHILNFDSRNNRNAFNLSAFYRNDAGSMKRSENNVGGIRLNFDSRANKVLWFGVNASITKGRQDAQSSIGWYGAPTATTLLRTTGDYSGFVKDYDDYSNDIRTTDNIYVQANFLQNLYLRVEAGIDYDNNTRYIWYGNGTDFGLEKNGAAALLSSSMLMYTSKVLLNYSLFVTDKNRLNFEAGCEFSGNIDKFNTMNGKDFFTHEMRAKGLSIGQGKADVRMFNRSLYNFGGYADISWQYSILAGAAIRFRADRTFHFEDTFNYYPAASAWVDLGKMSFMQNSVLSSLKLKGGWGMAGRDCFAPYELFSSFVPGLIIDGVVEGTEILYEGFNKVTTSEWNAGLELSLLKDRITIEAGYFDKTSDDIFNAYCFGEQKGSQGRWFHAEKKEVSSDYASVANKGVELAVNGVAIQTTDWKWSLSANTTLLSSKVTSVSEAASFGNSAGADVVTGANVVDYPVGSIYGYVTENGNLKEKTILGRTIPMCYGGLATTLSWKDLTLDIQTDYALGHQLLNMNKMSEDGASQVTDKYVENADFFRLARVSLCYDIPVRVSWLKKLTASLSGTNLLIASPYSGYNPDVNSYASPYSRGVDYGTAPLARSVVAGISLTF